MDNPSLITKNLWENTNGNLDFSCLLDEDFTPFDIADIEFSEPVDMLSTICGIKSNGLDVSNVYSSSEEDIEFSEPVDMLSTICGIKSNGLDISDVYSSSEEDIEFSEPVDMLSIICSIKSNGLDISDVYSPSDEDIEFSEPADFLFKDLFKNTGNKPVLKLPDMSDGLGAKKKNRNIVDLERIIIENYQFLFYKQQLFFYKPPCWIRISEHNLAVMLREIFEEEEIGGFLTSSEYKYISALLKIAPRIQRKEEFPSHNHLINLKDVTLDLSDMTFKSHDPEDGFFSYLDFTYSDMINTEGHVFENFIDTVSNGNPDVRQQVLELMAIIATGLEVKNFFVVLGPSGSGKTQFGRFLTELFGHEHVTTIRSMSEFSDKFALGDIEQKKLIMCLDLPDGQLPPSAIGMIKQLVGDDAIRIEQKYKNPITVYHKPLLFCAGNHSIKIPNIAEEEAFLQRMIIIPFIGTPEEGTNIPQLYRELLREAPYIIREAIGTYQNLISNGLRPIRTDIPMEYSPCDSRTSYNSVLEFYNTKCVSDENTEMATSTLYNVYLNTVNMDSDVTPSLTEFSRLFSEIVEIGSIPVRKIKRTNGSDKRGYSGITILNNN